MKFPIIHKYFSVNIIIAIILLYTFIALIAIIHITFPPIRDLIGHAHPWISRIVSSFISTSIILHYKYFCLIFYSFLLILIEFILRKSNILNRELIPNISRTYRIGIYFFSFIGILICIGLYIFYDIVLGTMRLLDTF